MHSKYIIRLPAILVAIFIIDISLAVINDPIMLFHKPWNHHQYYFKDMRKQAAGIINTHDFDSVILGTSMVQNTDAGEASSILGGTFVNISIGGGWLSERDLVLEYLLKKKKINTIIMTLDGFEAYGEYRKDVPVESFSYLYNDSRMDDLLAYLGFRKIGYLFCQNKIFSAKCPFTAETLTKANNWYLDQANSRRFGGLKNWLQYSNDPLIKDAFASILSSMDQGALPLNRDKLNTTIMNDRKVFSDYVMRHIKHNQDTQFYLLFPPYHRMKHAIWKNYNLTEYQIYKSRISMVVESIKNNANAKVFAFDDYNFVDDIVNYKDTRHYHPKYNTLMLHWMKEGKGKLTQEKLAIYFSVLDTRASTYDLQTLAQSIRNTLKSSEVPE